MYEEISYVSCLFLNSRILFTWVPTSGPTSGPGIHYSLTPFGAGTLTWRAPSSPQMTRLLYLFQAGVQTEAPRI